MPDDVEDFLRRAAQRRRAGAAAKREAAKPVRRVRPQYSNSRTERQVGLVDDAEEILMAEVVPDDTVSTSSYSARSVDQAIAAPGGSNANQPGPDQAAETLLAELSRALQSPKGIRQAILMREILDRPEHRW